MSDTLNFDTLEVMYKHHAIDYYYNEMCSRILPMYQDVAQTAENIAKENLWAQMNNGHAVVAGAEAVYETVKAQQREDESALAFVRDRILELAVAGLYHLWEREIVEFLFYDGIGSRQRIDRRQLSNFNAIVARLRDRGWNIDDPERHTFYNTLVELQLVANVSKHGAGSSLDRLREIPNAPVLDEMFIIPIEDYTPWYDYNATPVLKISMDDFARYHAAVKSFWSEAPIDIDLEEDDEYSQS